MKNKLDNIDKNVALFPRTIGILFLFLLSVILMNSVRGMAQDSQDLTWEIIEDGTSSSEAPLVLESDPEGLVFSLDTTNETSSSEAPLVLESDPEGFGFSLDTANENFDEFQLTSPTAEEKISELSAQENCWGRFGVGSWVRTRTTSISGVGINMVRTITETKQTLMEVRANEVVIKREMTVMTGASNVVQPSETVTYNFYEMAVPSQLTLTDQGPDNFSYKLMTIPCQVVEFQRLDPSWREVTKIWFSSVISPYLFKKETTLWQKESSQNSDLSMSNESLDEQEPFSHSVTEIILTNPGFRLNNVNKWWTQTTETDRNGAEKKTLTTHSLAVPGGVLNETTTKIDENIPVYHSVLKLLDYHVSPQN